MNRQHKMELGKCDWNGNGRASYPADVEWELTQYGRFSMCASVWYPDRHDIVAGGQMVDELARLFPDNAKLQRMAAIWERWHLNDLKAGSPAQTQYLREHPITDRLNHYTAACELLKAAGINPDPNYLHNGKPYAYGSAWLKEEIPAEIKAEIQSW